MSQRYLVALGPDHALFKKGEDVFLEGAEGLNIAFTRDAEEASIFDTEEEARQFAAGLLGMSSSNERTWSVAAAKPAEKPAVAITVELRSGQTKVTLTRADDGGTCSRAMVRTEKGWKGTRKAATEEKEFKAVFADVDDSDVLEDIDSALEVIMNAAQDIHGSLSMDDE